MDVFEICLNEVALEGLDGITLPTLWLRMKHRKNKIPVILSEGLKSHLWEYLVNNCDVEFFQLPHTREDPVIFDRFLGYDKTSGKHTAVAPDELDILTDPYLVKPVSHGVIKGSCPCFLTRVNVTSFVQGSDLNLVQAIDKFGERQLVIVASQSKRERMLSPPGVMREVVSDLPELEFCVLERIGRARHQGEIQTVLNKLVFKDLKTSHIHYIMKFLHTRSLVTKQSYSYARPDLKNKLHQQVLLFLPHYKQDTRTSTDRKLDEVCELLAREPGRLLECSEIMEALNIDSSSLKAIRRKLVASGVAEFKVHPGCKAAGTLMKRTLQLLKNKDALDEEDGEIPHDENPGLVAELPIAMQAYIYLLKCGEEGCTKNDFLRVMRGYGRLEARNVGRILTRAGVVNSVMVDHGRQRSERFIAKSFSRNSWRTKEFLDEKIKMKKILEASGTSDLSLEVTSAMQALECVGGVAGGVAGGETSESDVNTTLNPTADEESSIADVEQTDCPRRKWDSHLTTRKMKRTNIVLKLLDELKIVEGFTTIQKALQNEESLDGNSFKVCKKTVSRIVHKMAEDGLLKFITVPVTYNDHLMEVDYVMSMNCDPSRFKTAIEQTQFRIYAEDGKKAGNDVDSGIITSPKTLLHNPEVPEESLQYFHQPKCVRLQVLHEYLWYLAYGHPHNVSGNTGIEDIDYDKVQEYAAEITWKRFLPPVPIYPNYGPGWVQVGDAAVLIPLSILCQIHRYNYKIEGLEQHLSDPNKRNTLVRHLTKNMRGLLLHKRKYLFSIMDTIERLCFMGLLSRQKSTTTCLPKEEEMIYVHKNVAFHDTRVSDRSYMTTSGAANFEKINSTLHEFEDIAKYWIQLKDVCLMTPLGNRGLSETNPPEHPHYTQHMKKFIQEHITRPSKEPADDGSIPGDGRGAGGFDSSLFIHLYRNWHRSSNKQESKSKDLPMFNPKTSLSRLPKLIPSVLEGGKTKVVKKASSHESWKRKRKPTKDPGVGSEKKKLKISKKDLNQDYDITMVDNRGRNKVVKGGKGSKRKSQEIKPKPPKIAKQIMKHVDAADLQAMSNRRGKQRVNFSLDEDSILLLCKVVATVLLKKTSASTRTTFGTATHWSLVRDVLLQNCSKSCDKTSTACSRRQRFIMKNKLTRICHDLSVAEVLADVDLVEKVLRGRVDLTDQEASACFMELLPLVKLKFKGGVHGTMEGVIPDSVDELNQSYAVQAFTTEPTDHDHEDGITNKDDVLKCSIENLIFAVLASDEKHFNQYQTYKIFEDYPEPLVSQVSELLKKRNIVSKKLENPHRKRNLPFAVPSYHITKLYWQSFRSQHFSQVFDDCISSMNDLETQSPVTYKLDVNSGSIVSMLMSLLDDDLSLEINFPTELVMSDFKSIIGTDFYKSMKATEESMLADSHAKNDDPRKKKLMELFQMYQRHPSYSNWMMLSGVAGVVDEEKKILSHPEKLSLVPCIVEVQRPHRNQTKKHLFKYFEDKCVRYCDNGVQSCISKLLFSLRGPRFSRCDVIMIDGLDDITCFPENLRQLGKKMMEEIKLFDFTGIPVTKLEDKFLDQSHSADDIQQCLKILHETKFVFTSGISRARVIPRMHAGAWLSRGVVYKGEAGRGIGTGVGNPPNEDEQLDIVMSSTENVMSSTDDDDATSVKERFGAVNTSHYDIVKFLCRPWHHIDGQINYDTAKTFVAGVFLHILRNPGVNLRGLSKQFGHAMQRVVLEEVTQSLVDCKCVSRHSNEHVTGTWRIFNSDVISKNKKDDYYVTTNDGLLRLSYIIKLMDELVNEREKHFESLLKNE